MPRIMRRESMRREDFAELSIDQRAHLQMGYYWFDGYFKDRESFAFAWSLHRDELTADFRDKNRSATFVRPFAWWLLEHKKERPIVSTLFSREDIERFRRRSRISNHYGYLHTHVLAGVEMEPLQEHELDYLERLDLLTDEEREWMATLDLDDDSDLDD